MTCSCPEIQNYIDAIKSGEIIACQNIIKMVEHVERCFNEEDLYVDTEQLKRYLKIGELMYKEVFDWEKFACALLLCTYKNGKPRWNNALILMGRGAGKDGLIAWFSLCLTSRFNPIKKYDVDICANNEEQAMRPVLDVVEFLERPETIMKNKQTFHWTLEKVVGKENKGRIRGHTNSPKGKDGLRSGCVILNEIHQYQDYANVNVFTTGLGKVDHPRYLMFSTNGDVRDGVLDNYLNQAQAVLNEEENDDGWLYMLYSLDTKEEVHDERNWYKANPSLFYKPSLLDETRREYKTWKDNPQTLPAFMTKRMNLPEHASDKSVVDYDYIKGTNKPLVDLFRKPCVAGIDLSRTTDMASVSLLFSINKNRYVINHSWVCTASKDWERIKVKDQFDKWVDMGLLTIVDDIEINPMLIAEYLQEAKQKYNILKIAIDDFRQSIMAYDLNKIGFSKEQKNIKHVRPSDIARVVPVIESVFLNEQFYWGDNPILRWCTNNTKVVSWKARQTDGSEMGNQLYAKIEPKSRKTDAFMSLVAAMTCENELPQGATVTVSLSAVTL